MKKYTIELLLVIVSLVFIILGFPINNPNTLKSDIYIIEEPIVVELAWGFPKDSIQIDTFKVKRNQNLSDILIKKGVSAYEIDRIAKNSKEVFDVRKIKSGNSYYLISNDSTPTPNTFIYEESAIDYVVFNLDSLNVYRGAKELDTIQNTTAGIIESSLWNSFIANGSKPILALELSDIFAWTVDFFGIQRGDEYKVYYDELYVEEKFVGIGKVHAAIIIHMSDTISAFHFENNGQVGYFDENGSSLRKAFLKAPLKFSRISSRFSNSRMHPVLKIRRPHHGVDYAAPSGTPVYSIGDGTVVKKGYQKRGGGNYINIKHNSVYTSQYMHLKGYAKGLATGTRIKQGQLIGYVGKTGLATGPHLDFRVFKNGSPVDPLKVKAPPVEPIHEANKVAYKQVSDSLASILHAIQPPLPSEDLASE